MSRVRVLNLPRTVTEADLRTHFSQPVRGAAASAVPLEITDCRIVRKTDGANTVRMAFVGFRTTNAGQRAIKLFDGSYVGAQKIRVEAAQSLVEQRAEREKEKEQRKAALEHQRNKRRQEYNPSVDSAVATESAARRAPLSEQDRLRAEFVEKQVENRGPGWAAELLQPTAAQVSSAAAIPAVIDTEDAERLALQRQADLEAVDDSDFLAAITANAATHDDEPKVKELPSAPFAPPVAVPLKKRLSAEQQIAHDSRRVRLANVPYTATTAEVKNFISSVVGDVAEVHLPVTKDTKQMKGVAFITFLTSEAALKALDNDGAIFMGRLIHINAAPPDPYRLKREEDAQAKAAADAAKTTVEAPLRDNYKAAKFEKKKRTDRDLMWNPLFVESATAVAKIAQQLNVGSEDMVSVERSGAAVRAAIAEAYLTSEAQRVLGDEGINLGAIEGATLNRPRSNTTILVKHLPKNTPVRAIAKLFAEFGSIETIAAPSSGAFALIAFVHEEDAKRAFQRLAYKMIGGTPLYLEWAPVGAVKDTADDDEIEAQLLADDREDVTAQISKAARAAQRNDGRAALGVDDDDDDVAKAPAVVPLPTASKASASAAPAAVQPVSQAVVQAAVVYVTNLPFGLTEAAFLDFLQDVCKKFSANPSLVVKVAVLSTKGRAYVTVVDTTTAQYVIAKLNGRTIEGREISAQLSNSVASAAVRQPVAAAAATRAEDDAVRPAAKATTLRDGESQVPPDRNPLKVMVKNLPFEATERDLRELFKAFAEVKAVRVPNKANTFSRGHHENNHRGFGFVEFLTEQEAARAIATLSNTHLYGRHLVLEYAKL
jgi:multiple RNA-binding domain-containing protein 1